MPHQPDPFPQDSRSPYFSPDAEAMIRFRDALTARGIQTTIRASRGEDIQAACGLLSTQMKNEPA